MLYESTWDVIMNAIDWAVFSIDIHFLTVQAGKSEIKVLANLILL